MPQNSKRAALLRAGLEAVHRHGLAATGVAEIAKLSGAPKGSFYNHFPSKDAFAGAILEAYFDLVRSSLEEMSGPSAKRSSQRLRDYFQKLREYNARFGFARGCLIGNVAAEAASLSSSTCAGLEQHIRDWSSALASCIAEGQQAGDIRDDIPAGVLGRLLLDAWQGAVLRSKVERTAGSLDAFIDVLLPALLHPASCPA